MKKLESLNNEKFLLTPQKMGKLVGGERIYTATSPCVIQGVTNSGDIVSYANQKDQANNMESGRLYTFAGDNDTATRDAKLRELQSQQR